MLCARSAVAVRPRASSARAAPARSLRVVVRSTPADIEKETSKALKNADEVCKTGTTEDCAVAWDVVEELDAARSHKAAAAKANPASSDPLEQFCEGNPDADECRVYE